MQRCTGANHVRLKGYTKYTQHQHKTPYTTQQNNTKTRRAKTTRGTHKIINQNNHKNFGSQTQNKTRREPPKTPQQKHHLITKTKPYTNKHTNHPENTPPKKSPPHKNPIFNPQKPTPKIGKITLFRFPLQKHVSPLTILKQSGGRST